tara:strand:- start:10196 stop:10606 length:411 start_codon:yes stop_codon:yes gene_type:complete
MAEKTTKTSRTGAQFYQSDKEKKERLKRGGKETKTESAINEALLEKVLSGEMTTKEAGRMGANVFIDSVEDVHRRTDGQKAYEKKLKTGSMADRPGKGSDEPITKLNKGGKVQGYMHGGKVRAGDVRFNNKRGQTY